MQSTSPSTSVVEEKKTSEHAGTSSVVTKKTTAAIKSDTALAQTYVPEAWRVINERPVTMPMQAIPPAFSVPSNQHHKPHRLVPHTPQCGCPGGQGKSTRPFPHVLPTRSVVPEMYYAVAQRRLETLGNLSVSTLLKASLQKNGPLILDEFPTIQAYCQAWESLIVAERQHMLMLYERYTQYQASLGFPKDPKDNKFAELYLEGIADANPPLLIGDHVLIRPINQRIPHQAEIQSTVLSVDRIGKGRVQFSWISPEQERYLHPLYGSLRIPPSFQQGRCTVRFVPSKKVLQAQLSALDWARQTPSLMSFLYPKEAPVVPSGPSAFDILRQYHAPEDSHTLLLNLSLNRLNADQTAFVNMVLNRSLHPTTEDVRGPMILTGPAGTGKTGTMLAAVETLLALNRSSGHGRRPYRMLICTPSHTAADVITKRLSVALASMKPSADGPHNNVSSRPQDVLFRLYDVERPVETVPPVILPFTSQNEQTGGFVVPPPQQLLTYQVIVCTTIDAHVLYKLGLTNENLRVQRSCFAGYLSQACQQSGFGVQLQMPEEPHFTHLFLDEAAQATEPETVIPISVVFDPAEGVPKAEVTLVGDPRQLSPQVYCNPASEAGLGRSLMERLLQSKLSILGGGEKSMLGPELVGIDDWLQYSFKKDGHEQLSIFLKINYRCHASFLMMPSALFYFDKLQADGSDEDQAAFWCEKTKKLEALNRPVIPTDSELPEGMTFKKQEWPIHFFGVHGKDTNISIKSGFPSNTWSNQEEAEAVCEKVVLLVEIGVATNQIGVMASFRGQVVLIRGLLRKRGLSAVNVGTIEDFQSVECAVCIISLVRSTPDFVSHDSASRAGVFRQMKRSNVALTRGERMLIVIGSPTVMVEDPVWRQFLWFCLRNGLYYGSRWNQESSLVPPTSISSLQDNLEDSSSTMIISSIEQTLRSFS